MKNLILCCFVTALSTQTHALYCEAWSQKQNEALVKNKMEFKGLKSLTQDEMYRAKLNNYKYKVDWSKKLDILYARVVLSEKSEVFGTLRVPDLKTHNDAFLEFTNEKGDKVSISCFIKQ